MLLSLPPRHNGKYGGAILPEFLSGFGGMRLLLLNDGINDRLTLWLIVSPASNRSAESMARGRIADNARSVILHGGADP